MLGRQPTGRQQEVLGLLAGARTNRQIAAITGLSMATVKWYVSQLLGELELESRTEAGDWWRTKHGVRPRLHTPAKEKPMSGTHEATIHASGSTDGFSIGGRDLQIEEWAGSAPGELHVHHEHDISWHVLAGTLGFRLADRKVEVPAGSTIFIPAGTAHTYGEGADARYLVIGHPRLFELFVALRTARIGRHYTTWGSPEDAAIYAQFESELLEIREEGGQ